MPRTRSIKPEFWSDEKLGGLSFIERLLFLGMWTFADDEGLIRANPQLLKSQIFPYDDIKNAVIENALETFERKEMIFRYKISDQNYAWVVKFRIYQRIDKPQPSQNPTPDWKNQKYQLAIFKRDKFICKFCHRQTLPYIVKQSPCSCTDDYDPGLCASIDHFTLRVKGGNDYPSNLVTACVYCNKSKGAKNPEEYINDIRTFQEGSGNIPRIVLDETETETETETHMRTNGAGFETFWKNYPKKKSRVQAEKAWLKIKPNEQLLATMLAMIERAKTSVEWQKENGRYIPYPASWLNAKRWEDEEVVKKNRWTD